MEDSRIPELISAGKTYLEELESRLKEAQKVFAESQQQVEEISTEVDLLHRYLRVLEGGEENQPTPRKKKTDSPRTRTGTVVTSEKVLEILSKSPAPVSVAVIAETLEIPKNRYPNVYRAVHNLLAVGKVEQAGQETNERGRINKVYKLAGV